MNFVVGTAGHVDHGKSTLVQALTGIDPDRLAEEKRRRMTIDLGFAHMTLPSGRAIGIVDVPGHSRFVHNMLAGVHGLDAVVLVVAADEGVMPQTREHLDIVELMELRRAVVAITKADLVDADWLRMVRRDVEQELQGSTLAGSAMVAVSATRRTGLDELVSALDAALDGAPARAAGGRPRLPIDRVFTLTGFGTVVTGTLVEGSLSAGDEVVVMPSGRPARIRGIQQHNLATGRAEPGGRFALNLAGVAPADLRRGDVVTTPGPNEPVRRADAAVRVLASAPWPLRHGATLTLHTGTEEVSCRVSVLGANTIAPESDGWIQLRLAKPIAARASDRFVLRLPSPAITIAGGRFIDVNPRQHRRLDESVVGSLERRRGGAVLQEELAKYPDGIAIADLLDNTAASRADLTAAGCTVTGDFAFSLDAWTGLVDRFRRALAAHHAEHALRPGMPREELRSRLGLGHATFTAVLQALLSSGELKDSGREIALPGHRVVATEAVGAAPLLALLDRDPFAPPSIADAIRESGVGAEVVRALVQRGELVRLSSEIVFTRTAFDRAVGIVREQIESHGSITVAQLRDQLKASRRPVLALLEHLDAERVTRRVGDARVLR